MLVFMPSWWRDAAVIYYPCPGLRNSRPSGQAAKLAGGAAVRERVEEAAPRRAADVLSYALQAQRVAAPGSRIRRLEHFLDRCRRSAPSLRPDFRYNFVPLRRRTAKDGVVVADPATF